jgi:hypothetical protein
MEAIRSVVDLFKGQPLNTGDFMFFTATTDSRLVVTEKLVGDTERAVGKSLVIRDEM